MGLFIRQNDNRSQLQERLAAELREKARSRAISAEPIDQSTSSNYLKNTETTSGRAWLWLVLLAVLVLIFIIFAMNS